jgi:hypothetical protein
MMAAQCIDCGKDLVHDELEGGYLCIGCHSYFEPEMVGMEKETWHDLVLVKSKENG